MQYLENTYAEKLFVVDLKFRFNWESYIFYFLNLAILPPEKGSCNTIINTHYDDSSDFSSQRNL